jgi:cytochrome P450
MPGVAHSGDVQAGIDDQATEALENASLLSLDAGQHARIRRSILGHFSVKSVRSHQESVDQIVDSEFTHFLSKKSPADLTEHFAEIVASNVHALVLGIPERLTSKYRELYIYESGNQAKFDFVREVLDAKAGGLRDDVLSDLLSSDLTPSEVEGLAFTLFISGRDSVAYTIVTSIVALLMRPDQLKELRENPELMPGAIEEFMRFGSMFVTLFPRTALEDVQFGEILITQGQTVSVSQVAANRDPSRFESPDEFDLSRDAFGHIGFGHGIHGCVGQQLARIEIRTAVSRLISSLPGLRLIEADQTKPQPFANPVATYEAGRVIVGWDS